MAARRTALSALLFIFVQMAPAASSANEKGPALMRRVSRHGEPSSATSGSPEFITAREKKEFVITNHSSGNPAAWCNSYYPRGEWKTNTCTSGSQIDSMDECRHAASALNYSTASDFETNEHTINPLPRPHKCFVYHHIVQFNPSGNPLPDPVPSDFDGTPICKDRIYTQGGYLGGYLTHITEADLCPPEYKLVDTWEECEWAHDCEYGGMYCEEVGADNSQHASTLRTPGCYRNAIGCFGFNRLQVADMNATWYVNSTPVCKMETYTFHGHPKYMASPTISPPTPAPSPR